MDGALTPKAGSGGKAVLPEPAGIDAGAAATTTSARGARKVTLAGAAAGAADAPAGATAAPGEESNGGGRGEEEEEEEDDEQVERFYALLDNIRAMRGAYVSGSGSGDGAGAHDGVVDADGGGARVKRLRGSEPPWRPAFRLEDFEEPTPTSSLPSDVAPCAKRTRGQDADGDGEESGGARAAVAAAAAVRVRLDSGRKSV